MRLVALPDNRHLYFTHLLEESLRAAGHEPVLTIVANVPQPRIWEMVASNQLSLIWGVQSRARDAAYASVANALTNGLAGQRILLVRKGQEQAYAGVRTLDDFRRLGKVGGLGAGWFDVDAWRSNGLPLYVKPGDWRQMFAMVASGERGIDYIARGASEIVNEVRAHPGLAIEQNLVLVHDHDMRFYLSPEAARYKPVIEEALAQADRSGLKKRLIERYLMPDARGLSLDRRVRLKLDSQAH
ncbi:hypothetical protein [Pelomonas sp. KK5]|uniref:hypothetical protein n=1 Tax=Pelomonas sp. KK5 TaxID=1855730 RepID=UPI0009FA68BD|nr:hypothetical protein [Pelomonas sp. KK5]